MGFEPAPGTPRTDYRADQSAGHAARRARHLANRICGLGAAADDGRPPPSDRRRAGGAVHAAGTEARIHDLCRTVADEGQQRVALSLLAELPVRRPELARPATPTQRRRRVRRARQPETGRVAASGSDEIRLPTRAGCFSTGTPPGKSRSTCRPATTSCAASSGSLAESSAAPTGGLRSGSSAVSTWPRDLVLLPRRSIPGPRARVHGKLADRHGEVYARTPTSSSRSRHSSSCCRYGRTVMLRPPLAATNPSWGR